MNRLLTSSTIVVVGLLSFATFARADTINPAIVANGSTIFQSNGFESDAVGAVPSVTAAGSWNIQNGGGSNDAAVRAGGSAGLPAAAYGSNLLNLSTDALGSDQPMAEMVMGSPAVAGGDSVKVKFNLYVDSVGNTSRGSLFANFMTAAGTFSPYGNGQNFLKIGFQNGDFVGEAATTTGIGPNDMIMAWYDGSKYNNVMRSGTNMYLLPDAWHSVEMEATVGGAWTMTVDGVTSDAAGWRSGHAGDSNIASFMVGGASGNATHFMIDGQHVPEPSTVTLLALAMIGLLAYAWRK